MGGIGLQQLAPFVLVVHFQVETEGEHAVHIGARLLLLFGCDQLDGFYMGAVFMLIKRGVLHHIHQLGLKVVPFFISRFGLLNGALPVIMVDHKRVRWVYELAFDGLFFDLFHPLIDPCCILVESEVKLFLVGSNRWVSRCCI